jgi:magnesium transporter
VAALRREGRFFWIDASLAETSPEELGAVLGISERALETVTGFGEHRSRRKFRAEGEHLAFAFSCYVDSEQPAAETSFRLRPLEVHVLVTGDYLLTLHEEPLSLPALLAPDLPEGRSEQFAVYAVLEALLSTAFDALTEVELRLDDLAVTSTDMRSGRLRMATLRSISSQLSGMRRRVGPQRGLFERIGVEIGRVPGLERDEEIGRVPGLERDEESYLDRLGAQVNRLVEAIDAAGNAMATLIDLRLNETSYWLTVVATIFLPLTFITGFFGMNFGWMVREVNTQAAFWLLGVGSLVVGVALIWALVVRGSPVEERGRDRLPQ